MVNKAAVNNRPGRTRRSDVLEHTLRGGGLKARSRAIPWKDMRRPCAWGKDKVASIVILVEDDQAYAELLGSCAPIVQVLKKNLYPKVTDTENV